MASECDSQQSIKFYLEAFLPYICKCVRATDLLVYLPFFEKAELKEIHLLSTTSPIQATKLAIETLLKKNDPGIYMAFKEAMGPDQADVPKVFDILSGRNFPSQEGEQYTAVIQLFMDELIGRISPTTILPLLKREGTLSIGEEEEIKCEERNRGQRNAAWLLLYYLPQRIEGWFKIFVKALIEDNHADLAKKLDPDMYEKITAQLEDSSEGPTIEATEGKEAVWNAFEETAVEDIKLKNASEEQCDQNLMETEETPVKMSTSDGNLLHDTGIGSTLEQKTNELPSYSANSDIQYFQNGKSNSINDNLDTFEEPKLSDKKIKVETTEYMEPLVKKPRTGTHTDTSIEKTVNKIVLGRKLGEDNPIMKKQPTFKLQSTVDKRSLDTLSKSSSGTTAATLSEMQSASLLDAHYMEQSGFPLPKEEKIEVVSPGEMVDTELDDLIASLKFCSLTDVGDSRYGETIQEEAENDLDAKVQRSAHTDFANIEVPESDSDNIKNPIEREIALRGYQKELAVDGCEGDNAIIVAPTNSGKTWVACKIIQDHFRKSKGKRAAKCAFIVENTALALQQGGCCAELLSHLRTKVITGDIQRERKEYLKDFVDRRDILVVTAKVLHNTLEQKEIDGIQKFSLMIFDECHHTMSDHPYNEIMHVYLDAKLNGVPIESLPQIVGLTASLGVGGGNTADKAVKHMQTLMANLDASSLCRVRKNQMELEKYQNNPDEAILAIPRREDGLFRSAVSKIMMAIEDFIERTKEEMTPADVEKVNKIVKSIPAEKGSESYIQWLSELMKKQVQIKSKDMRRVLNSCRLHLMDYNQAILLYADARVGDALDILGKSMEQRRRQGINQMEHIMLKIYDKLKQLDYSACNFNPKLGKIKEILLNVLGGDENARGIIFVKTRRLAGYLVKWMKETDRLKDLNPRAFVGQIASVEIGGMTKNAQRDVLELFKDGFHKLIVATSVAEEGLDITKCNLVIRYEHVTNEIVRTQSRGRARAPGSRYYVITGQGSPIADKEEKNAEAEKLMNAAVVILEQLIENDRNGFESKLSMLQSSEKMKRQMKAKRKIERLIEGDFKFQCLHCSSFICWSSDIKKIQCHYLCVDVDVSKRVTCKRSLIPEYEENDVKMGGGTFCNDCQSLLGGVYNYKGIDRDFPMIKIQFFRTVDKNGIPDHTTKWKGARCKVEEMEKGDLLNIAIRNNDC